MYGLSAGVKMMVVLERRRYLSKSIYFFFIIKDHVHEFP